MTSSSSKTKITITFLYFCLTYSYISTRSFIFISIGSIIFGANINDVYRQRQSTSNIKSLTSDIVAYKYLGCYGDRGFPGRSMAFKIGFDIHSISQCYSLALANNYLYFSLQNGQECWASNNYTQAVIYHQCGSTCTGTLQYCSCSLKCMNLGPDICGGGWANDLYVIDYKLLIPTPASLSTYIPLTLSSNVPTNRPAQTPSAFPSSRPLYSPSVYPTYAPISSPTMYPATSIPSKNPLNPSYISTSYKYLGCYGDRGDPNRSMTLKVGVNIYSVSQCYSLALTNSYKYFSLQNGAECWVSNNYTQAITYHECGPMCNGILQYCKCSIKCMNVGPDMCGGGWANDLYEIVYTRSVSTQSPSIVPKLLSPSFPTILPSKVSTLIPSSIPSKKPLTVLIFPTNKPSELKIISVLSYPTAVPSIRSTTYKYLGCYGDRGDPNRSMTLKVGVNIYSVSQCYSLALTNSYKYFSLQNGAECWVSNNYTQAITYHECGPMCNGILQYCKCSIKCMNVGPDMCGGGWANDLYEIVYTNLERTLSPSKEASPMMIPSSNARSSAKPFVLNPLIAPTPLPLQLTSPIYASTVKPTFYPSTSSTLKHSVQPSSLNQLASFTNKPFLSKDGSVPTLSPSTAQLISLFSVRQPVTNVSSTIDFDSVLGKKVFQLAVSKSLNYAITSSFIIVLNQTKSTMQQHLNPVVNYNVMYTELLPSDIIKGLAAILYKSILSGRFTKNLHDYSKALSFPTFMWVNATANVVFTGVDLKSSKPTRLPTSTPSIVPTKLPTASPQTNSPIMTITTSLTVESSDSSLTVIGAAVGIFFLIVIFGMCFLYFYLKSEHWHVSKKKKLQVHILDLQHAYIDVEMYERKGLRPPEYVQ